MDDKFDFDHMADDRLDGLILFSREHRSGGFVNNVVMYGELLSALSELRDYRRRERTPDRSLAFRDAADMVSTLKVKCDELGLVENALKVIEAGLRYLAENPNVDIATMFEPVGITVRS